jgi:hypothetical protein
MNAKEKANFLVNEMINQTWNFSSHHLNTLAAKQCSIVAINEIIKELIEVNSLFGLELEDNLLSYWNDVKKEIELL